MKLPPGRFTVNLDLKDVDPKVLAIIMGDDSIMYRLPERTPPVDPENGYAPHSVTSTPAPPPLPVEQAAERYRQAELRVEAAYSVEEACSRMLVQAQRLSSDARRASIDAHDELLRSIVSS